MFAIEIDFHDGISPPETILVRRSNAIVGTSDHAHVVVEGAASSACELRLIRGLGREFSCIPVKRREAAGVVPTFIEGSYCGEALIRLGSLGLCVTPLDIDLNLLANEFPDKAAVRIVRSALTRPSPVFPAVVVAGTRPIFVSFFDDSSLVIGRSRNCGLRLDASDVSSEHARVGVDKGRCWVEDLGSTNGTLVGDVRISGRHYLEPGERISVGSEFSLAIALSLDDVRRVGPELGEDSEPSGRGFPCIVSNSDLVRPQSLPLKPHVKVSVGRDPANHIWVNAPHISRSHLELVWTGEDLVRVVDSSSNGSYVHGSRLTKDKPLELGRELTVFDLCSGISLALCFSAEDERVYRGGDASEDADSEEVSEDSILEFPQEPADYPPRITAEETRKILEKAAGLTDAIPGVGTAKFTGSGVFTRLAKERSQESENLAVNTGYAASEQLGSDSTKTSLGLVESGGENYPNGEKQGFRDYQEARRHDRNGIREFDTDFNLLSEAEFDEEFLESGSFSGFGRLAIMALVILLVLVILVLFINIFTGRVF